MTKRSILLVLVMSVAVGCQIADPNPAVIPGGGNGGTSSAGASTGGNQAGAGGSGVTAGTGAGTGGAGAEADAGAGGHGEAPAGGAAGTGSALGDGGVGGEAGGVGGDDCSPACSSSQTCVTGACKDLDCTPSASVCSGSSLRTCAADGLSSTEVMTCGGGKYCDPDSASCQQGYAACSQLYLGSGRFGANPRPALQANDAIVLSSYQVEVNKVVAGQVRINNLGSDDSPSTHLELYLSEAPGFAAPQSRLMYQQDVVVPGAALGGPPGEYTFPWSYTFSSVGHYVLLARIQNNSPPTGAACTKQGYDLSSPTTDSQTAIHYLNVVP